MWIDYGSISGGSIIDPIPEGPDIGPIINPGPQGDDYEPPEGPIEIEPEGPQGDPIPPDQGNDPFTKKPGEQGQINDVAHEFELDPREFGDYVEESKEGKRGDDNYTYQELRELAKEMKEEKGGGKK